MLEVLALIDASLSNVKLAVRKSRGEAVHEVEDTAAAFGVRRDDLSGRNFERRKQRRRAMPLASIMSLCGRVPYYRLPGVLRDHPEMRSLVR